MTNQTTQTTLDQVRDTLLALRLTHRQRRLLGGRGDATAYARWAGEQVCGLADGTEAALDTAAYRRADLVSMSADAIGHYRQAAYALRHGDAATAAYYAGLAAADCERLTLTA